MMVVAKNKSKGREKQKSHIYAHTPICLYYENSKNNNNNDMERV